MQYIDDYSDERLKSWCIYCGASISEVHTNRDHVPTKSLLSNQLRSRGANYDRGKGDLEDYLPQVTVCKKCNSDFAPDEIYLVCVLHAVLAGSLYPDPSNHPDAANVLRSNREIVRSLKADADGQMFLFDNLKPFTLYPDPARIRRVVLKNARGHAYHEIGEPMFGEPTSIWFRPLVTMNADELAAYEQAGGLGIDVWPEVGSRMTLRVAEGLDMAGGWVEVERGRYRYAIDWSSGITVRTVIWEYLATETHWEP